MKNTQDNRRAYVAFLRGINVSGHKKVPMVELKKVFEAMGFQSVNTILATGNVVFEAKEEHIEKLAKIIGSKLEKTFGFAIYIIVRTVFDIEKVIKENPFKDVKVGPKTRLYITFLSEKPKNQLKIPYNSPDKSFRILSMANTAIFSVLDLTKTRTTDAMNILRKEFGNNITTRNWNTIIKIIKL